MPPLHVLTCVFNPQRWRSRIRLFEEFRRYVESHGCELWVAEVAFGDRPFAVTGQRPERELQLRTSCELWHKERMLNLLAQRLPQDWQCLAWIDADISFARPDWCEETVQLLQHTPVLQMFSRAIDLSPDYTPTATHKGFVSAYRTGELDPSKPPYEGAHPGFAWAFRRDAFDALGGLFDVSILGSGDRHMACALMSDVKRSYPPGLSEGYVEQLRLYQSRASQLKQNIGYLPGLILHGWHGKKKDRRYLDRWQVLVKHQYDPELDVKPDWQGLWQWTDRSPQLVQEVRDYFACRNEDSIDVA